MVGGSVPSEPTTQSFEPEYFSETAEKPQLAGFCGCVSVSAETVSGLNAIWALCLWAEEYRFPDADPAVVKASVPISLVGLDKRGRLHFRAGHGDPLGHHGD